MSLDAIRGIIAKVKDQFKSPEDHIRGILKGEPVSPSLWDSPENLWEPIKLPEPPPIKKRDYYANTAPRVRMGPTDGLRDEQSRRRNPHKHSWTILQAMVFADRLGEVPPHIDLVKKTLPETKESLLHLAVKWEKPSQIRLLLEKGADVNQPDAAGKTPVDLANECVPDRIPSIATQNVMGQAATREKARQALKSGSDIEL